MKWLTAKVLVPKRIHNEISKYFSSMHLSIQEVYERIHDRFVFVCRYFSLIEYDHLRIHKDIDNRWCVNFRFQMRKHLLVLDSTKATKKNEFRKRDSWDHREHTVSGLMQARSGCFRLLQRGKRYARERSPIKSRFVPSSTDALICSSCGSVKLRIN